jgi:glycosyltransferase involved in cell wall biosynthesis
MIGRTINETRRALVYYRVPERASSFRVVADHHLRELGAQGWETTEADLRFDRPALESRGPAAPVAIVQPLFCYANWAGTDFPAIVSALRRRHRWLLGLEVADTSRISARFVGWANHPEVSALILPSRTAVDAYRASGVVTSLHCVPHGVEPVAPSTRFAALRADPRPKILCFVLEDPRRKGWDLVQKLMPAFRDCSFVVKRLRYGPEGDGTPRAFSPNMVTVDDWLPVHDLASLYVNCDVLLSLHRGGAFELNCAEAAAYGLPVVTPRHGCVLEYLDERTAHFVDVAELVRVHPPGDDHCGLGAVANLGDAVKRLRGVVAGLTEAKAAALAARDRFRETWSWAAAGGKLSEAITEIIARRNKHTPGPTPHSAGRR